MTASKLTAEEILLPEELARSSAAEIDRLIGRLDAAVPKSEGWVDLASTGATEALVFGDTHGDWPSVRGLAHEFERSPGAALVGLGDYIDRTPADCVDGSALSALYLLQLAAAYAPRVVLIRGNHETFADLPVAPRSFEPEVDHAWGADIRRSARILQLLNRGPLAAVSPSGAYLAHAGFPRSPRPDPWTKAIDPGNAFRLTEIAWADCAASRNRRGVAAPFYERDLREFLQGTGLGVFLRGHDPDLTRKSIYNGQCLTLHTTRYYARFGGVILARLPLTGRVTSTSELKVQDVAPLGIPG